MVHGDVHQRPNISVEYARMWISQERITSSLGTSRAGIRLVRRIKRRQIRTMLIGGFTSRKKTAYHVEIRDDQLEWMIVRMNNELIRDNPYCVISGEYEDDEGYEEVKLRANVSTVVQGYPLVVSEMEWRERHPDEDSLEIEMMQRQLVEVEDSESGYTINFCQKGSVVYDNDSVEDVDIARGGSHTRGRYIRITTARGL